LEEHATDNDLLGNIGLVQEIFDEDHAKTVVLDVVCRKGGQRNSDIVVVALGIKLNLKVVLPQAFWFVVVASVSEGAITTLETKACCLTLRYD
jgi:hypothetical protein